MYFNMLQRRGIILPFDGLLKKVNENVFQAALGHLLCIGLASCPTLKCSWTPAKLKSWIKTTPPTHKEKKNNIKIKIVYFNIKFIQNN